MGMATFSMFATATRGCVFVKLINSIQLNK